MSQNWLVSGLNAVDSGLHLYLDVWRMVCSHEEDSGRSGQGRDWNQKQDNRKNKGNKQSGQKA